MSSRVGRRRPHYIYIIAPRIQAAVTHTPSAHFGSGGAMGGRADFIRFVNTLVFEKGKRLKHFRTYFLPFSKQAANIKTGREQSHDFPGPVLYTKHQ